MADVSSSLSPDDAAAVADLAKTLPHEDVEALANGNLHLVSEGSLSKLAGVGSDPNAPIPANLFSDSGRVKASFGNPTGVSEMLSSEGYSNPTTNKSGDLVAQKDGKWYRDKNNFWGHPVNWLESAAGGALPNAGMVAGGGVGALAEGVGEIPGAAAGSAVGEYVRQQIGGKLGVYKNATDKERAIDIAKQGAMGGLGAAAGKYIVGPLMKNAFVPLAGPGATEAEALAAKALGDNAEPAAESAVEPPAPTKTPQNMEDVRAGNKLAESLGFNKDSPSLEAAEKAEAILGPDLQLKPLGPQKNALKGRQQMVDWQAMLRNGTPEAEELNARMAYQKQELISHIDKNIEALAPGAVESDPIKANELAIDLVRSKDQQIKDAAGPIFQAAQAIPVNSADASEAVLQGISKKYPNIHNFIVPDAKTGQFKMMPYSQQMGMSQQAYGVIEGALKTINNEPLSIPGLQNMRETMRKMFPYGDPNAEDIGKIRSGMLDAIESLVHEKSPDLNIRKAFTDWAINERQKEGIEKVIQGSLDPYAKNQPNTDKILSNIFKSSDNAAKLKDYLGGDFNTVAANHLNQLKQAATKDSFSPASFSTMLRKASPALDSTLSESQPFQKVKAAATLARLVPEPPPANPSETGAMNAAIQKSHGIIKAISNTPLTELPGKAIGALAKPIADYSQRNALDKMLATETPKTFMEKFGGAGNSFLGRQILPSYGPMNAIQNRLDKKDKK